MKENILQIIRILLEKTAGEQLYRKELMVLFKLLEELDEK